MSLFLIIGIFWLFSLNISKTKYKIWWNKILAMKINMNKKKTIKMNVLIKRNHRVNLKKLSNNEIKAIVISIREQLSMLQGEFYGKLKFDFLLHHKSHVQKYSNHELWRKGIHNSFVMNLVWIRLRQEDLLDGLFWKTNTYHDTMIQWYIGKRNKVGFISTTCVFKSTTMAIIRARLLLIIRLEKVGHNQFFIYI